MHRSFHPRHANVVDQPTPRVIAVAVDEHEPAGGAEHPVHLGHGAILVGIMVEAVGAGHDVERPGGERQALAISLHGLDLPDLGAPAVRSLGQHRAHKIDAPDARGGHGLAEPARERAGPAADVKDPDRLVSGEGPNPADQGTVRRPEQQPLQDATVVTLAPAVEFVSRLVFVVRQWSLRAANGENGRVRRSLYFISPGNATRLDDRWIAKSEFRPKGACCNRRRHVTSPKGKQGPLQANALAGAS